MVNGEHSEKSIKPDDNCVILSKVIGKTRRATVVIVFLKIKIALICKQNEVVYIVFEKRM